MTRGGWPTTVAQSGTSRLTTAPAPMRACLPTRMSPTSTAPAPIQHPSPMTGAFRLTSPMVTFW